ncbi:unnamed protein product, partial [Discosporangium mesarthrocarpum]
PVVSPQSEGGEGGGMIISMPDENPSERRRKCDHAMCSMMATHGFILPRVCGQHREPRMLRIVPASVSSGDEWGSEPEADARTRGRVKRSKEAVQQQARRKRRPAAARPRKTKAKGG